MRSPCHLREPGPSHCQIAAKGWGRAPPRAGTQLSPQDIPVQLVRGCSPPLWRPFLFNGDRLKISQSRGRVRGGGGEVPAETRAGKSALHPLLHGAGGGHVLCRWATHSPPPAAGLLPTHFSKPHRGPDRLCCSRGPLATPLSYRKKQAGEGCPLDAWVSGECQPAPEAVGGALAGPTLGWRRGVQVGLISHTFLCQGPASGPHPSPRSHRILALEPTSKAHSWLGWPTRSLSGPRGARGASAWDVEEEPHLTPLHSRAPWLYGSSICLRL